eukprot:gnl/MRDRNA2_/MRDRNA2_176095_c0_seq1.p1 gnl/MRDRNA2_/MRDRNA2_176095_c0~~gnl/MRDRNA2_/MRDRNA2_176095_c0_seq1.p1  ORF type:complete len:180 (+),score=25.80 gnl/MRDRNA2_/MRDRNA2_176095_c0_seq1:237-776(+)
MLSDENFKNQKYDHWRYSYERVHNDSKNAVMVWWSVPTDDPPYRFHPFTYQSDEKWEKALALEGGETSDRLGLLKDLMHSVCVRFSSEADSVRCKKFTTPHESGSEQVIKVSELLNGYLPPEQERDPTLTMITSGYRDNAVTHSIPGALTYVACAMMCMKRFCNYREPSHTWVQPLMHA